MEELNKQSLYQLIQQKININNEKLDEDWNKIVDELKQTTKDERQLEQFSVMRMHAMYKKQLRGRGEAFEGVIICIGPTTDYGAGKQYETAISYWEQSNDAQKQQMIKEGKYNTDGTPLWHNGITTAKFKHGNIIDPANEKTTLVYAIAQGKTEKSPKKCLITVKCETVPELPIHKPVRFSGVRLTKTTEDTIYVNAQEDTFEIITAEEEDIDKIIEQYYPENVCPIGSLMDFHEKHKDALDRFVVFKGNISEISLTKAEISNRVVIEHPSITFNDDTGIVAWVPKSYKLDMLQEGMINVTIFGRTNINKDDKLSVGCYGFYVPKMFRVEKPLPIK